jgi:hypothetical protein
MGKPISGKEISRKLQSFLLSIGNLVESKKFKGSLIYVSKIDNSFICFSNGCDIVKALMKYGVTEQIQSSRNDSEGTINIGFNPLNKKWYGWSHRAIVAFGIGDKIFEKDFGNNKTPFIKHGSKTIKTFSDAKKAAINFANYIG